MRHVPLSLALLLVVAGSAIAACGTTAEPGSASPEGGALDGGIDGASAEVSVHSVFDLPRSSATEALSATAFDIATRTLFALQDNQARIVPLVAGEDFKTWTVGAPIALTGRAAGPWDGEGLVRSGDLFIAVTNETTPTIERFDGEGRFVDAVTTPPKLASQSTGNKGLESLALSPDTRYLFTANESALTTDGAPASAARGTVVRVVRLDAQTKSTEQYAYRTDSLGPGTGGDMGVSELAAISDTVLLVLERGFQSGYGNTVKIYRVDLAGGYRVDAVDAITDATPVLAKTLVVDIGALPPGDVTHPAEQPNPLLDNYEALAIGPTLSDGRRLLFVTSDDNASRVQVARVLVLAVPSL